MSNIGDLVERLVAKGISVGEASEIIALAVAAGASTAPYRKPKPAKAKNLFGEEEDLALRGRKPERLMPEGFHLNATLREFAAERGFPKCDFIFDQFRSHHRAKGSKFVDWEAAWRTWVLNQVRFNGGAQQPRQPITSDGRI